MLCINGFDDIYTSTAACSIAVLLDFLPTRFFSSAPRELGRKHIFQIFLAVDQNCTINQILKENKENEFNN